MGRGPAGDQRVGQHCDDWPHLVRADRSLSPSGRNPARAVDRYCPRASATNRLRGRPSDGGRRILNARVTRRSPNTGCIGLAMDRGGSSCGQPRLDRLALRSTPRPYGTRLPARHGPSTRCHQLATNNCLDFAGCSVDDTRGYRTHLIRQPGAADATTAADRDKATSRNAG